MRRRDRLLRPIRTIAAWGALSLLLAPGRAEASDDEELDVARGLLDGAQYAEAAARFQRMLEPGAGPCPKASGLTAEGCRLTDSGVIQRARGLYTIALHALNRPNEAKEQFKLLLRDNPTFTPSPALYPPKVILLFTEAKSEIEAELTAATIAAQKKKAEAEAARKKYEAWLLEIEKIAATETVVSERSRWIAAIPFGVGQFQNEAWALGALFLSVESLALTGTVTTAVLQDQYVECGRVAECATDHEQLNQQLSTIRVVNYVSLGVLGAAIITGIIEAEVNFEPVKITTKKRKLPEKPQLPPPVSAGLTGVPLAPEALGLGVTLRF